MSDLSPLSGVERKLDSGDVRPLLTHMRHRQEPLTALDEGCYI
jgi:hypothetical protein